MSASKKPKLKVGQTVVLRGRVGTVVEKMKSSAPGVAYVRVEDDLGRHVVFTDDPTLVIP